MSVEPPREQEPAVSYYEQPALKRPHWGWNVVTYLFLGGIMGGSSLIAALADARASQSQRRLVRNANRELPDGVKRVLGDLNEPSTLRPALAGVFAAFLMPGYRDMPGLLEECRRAGVGRVVLLSGSSAAATNPNNAISRYMLSSEAAVQESGLDWTILRPCAFMSNALQWLPQLRSSDVLRLEFADVAAAVIDPFDIAAVAAVALTNDGHAERTYALSGPQSGSDPRPRARAGAARRAPRQRNRARRDGGDDAG